MARAMPWADLDDSSSFTGTTYSTTTSSTVLGPGAITGKFLKTVGEKSLDFIVTMIIRSRLGGIERVLEKNPRLLRNPVGEEWPKLTGIYNDLHELCRESRSDYYPQSIQRTAAKLVHEITLITRPAPEFYIEASPTNNRWEALLAHVQRREELLEHIEQSTNSTKRFSKRDSISFNFGRTPTNDRWEALITRVQRRRKSSGEPQGVVSSPSRRYSNSSVLEPPESPINDTGIIAKDEAKGSQGLEDARRSRRTSGIRDRIFKSRSSQLLEEDPSPLIQYHAPTRRVLVLGAGGVGKSTLVKQIQATVKISSPPDTESYGEVVLNNVMEAMRNIIHDVDPLDLSRNARDSFQNIMDGYSSDWGPSRALSVIRTLWREPAVRRSARRSRLGMLPEPGLESADYFFDWAYRIFSPNYEPSHDDIVRSRIRTTGIWETPLRIRDNPWVLIDTGGERSERKKWVNCQHDATAVLFVAALSDYNKTLYEDSETNRMEESLSLFGSVANSPQFTKSLIMLIFNKIDAFVETLEVVPLKNYFFDYTGGDSYDACQYFERRFLSLVEDKDRQVVIKYTCAVNAEALPGTLRSVEEDIDRHHEHNLISR